MGAAQVVEFVIKSFEAFLILQIVKVAHNIDP